MVGGSSAAETSQSTVSAHATRRIVNLLSDTDSDISLSLLATGDDCLDLMRLNVKQLKNVAKKLNSSNDDEFSMPKSGARKAVWVNAIADFFRRPTDSHSVGVTVAKRGNTAVTTARSSSSKSTPKKPAARKTNTAIDSDEAMARALQQQYMQEDNQLTGLFGGAAANVHNGQKNSIALPTGAVGGIKRPANSSSNNAKQPGYAKVKVKKERYHLSSTNAHSLSHEEGSDRPNDVREASLVDNMRNMGFTDTREILAGLRAVATQREENISIVATAGWSTQEHVEAAMMWIITQREEAAEARKEDEARVSSEIADAKTMQRRKEELELEMMNSELNDLLGSADEEVEIASKYFPHSVILQSIPNRRMFTTILSVDDPVATTHARKEVLRYLKLEKKSTDWYGRVLPYSFFNYSEKSRFERWAEELTSNGYKVQFSQRLTKACDELENALYNLSQQQEGVASVPKVFIQAQKEAANKGLPIQDRRDAVDDEIEVLEHSSSSKTMSSEKQETADVIEIL
jgi:hypothetical protein